jgi:GGDEF domain-containing protein
MKPCIVGDGSISVTCSIGIASRSLARAFDADSLVREADLALYDAKGCGRNRVQEASEKSLALPILAGSVAKG